jgi:transcriptional regulator with XRE-family HTH domain
MNISEKIIAAREAKKIKQIDVAKALDMEQSNYSRIENKGNKLTLEQLEKICSVLGITLDELLHWGEEKKGDTTEELERVKKELDDLKEKNGYLKSINELQESILDETEEYFLGEDYTYFYNHSLMEEFYKKKDYYKPIIWTYEGEMCEVSSERIPLIDDNLFTDDVTNTSLKEKIIDFEDKFYKENPRKNKYLPHRILLFEAKKPNSDEQKLLDELRINAFINLLKSHNFIKYCLKKKLYTIFGLLKTCICYYADIRNEDEEDLDDSEDYKKKPIYQRYLRLKDLISNNAKLTKRINSITKTFRT